MDKVDRFARYLVEGFDCRELIDPGLGLPGTAGLAASLERSLIVCRTESALNAGEKQLAQLHGWLDHAPAGILVTPPDHRIARPNDLQDFLRERGLRVPFVGWAEDQKVMMAVLENNFAPPRDAAPGSLRVVAFMPAYNEADIIHSSLRYLIAQGIDVYIVDNWSTDGTFERAQEFLGKGLTGIERFPPDGPADTYEWRSILGRIETLASQLEADWFMLHDADERRHSPWEGVGLKAGLHHVDRCGFNCIDHTVLNFSPVDNSFDPAHDVENQLRYYSFSDHPGHFHQRKIWKNLRCGVSLAASAGHDICFPGRLVYPYKFLMKHYPVRSQSHGQWKVFRDRAKRWSPAERSLGWHQQYDDIKSTDSFLRDPATLEHVSGAEFDGKYLIERLSGIGIFHEAPWWATSPRQSF